jgi:phosphoglycerol transferase MdoB-like AlkP superfamily enzyme
MMRPWDRFFTQFQKDLKLWLLFVAVLSLSRIAFIVAFRAELVAGGAAGNIIAALAYGLRFDVVVAGYWMLAPLAMSVLCGVRDWQAAAERVRAICGSAFIVFTVLLSIVNVEYYREYHDLFNHFLFKVGEDDTSAIASTIYAGYHPIAYLALAVVLIALGLVIRKRWFASEFVSPDVVRKYTASHWARGALTVAAVATVFVGIRGSFGYRPVEAKDAAITPDRMLNKAVLNCQMALLGAVDEHCAVTGAGGLETFLPDGNVAGALAEAFPKAPPATTGIDACLERTAAGPRGIPPRHIFLLQMESYDAWPLLDKYAGLGLAENGRWMAREGLHLTAYVASGGGTIETFATLITGMPYALLPVQLETAGRRPLPTSLPETFRRLGYRTRFFYGGYLSWEEVGDFATWQGFDEVYGAAALLQGVPASEWGVADQYLFDLVEKTVTDDRPSLNVVMTTSYHPPFVFDIPALGVAIPTVPKELDAEFTADRPRMLRILAHLRYSDVAMGRFVRQTEAKLPRALFAATGDHFSRRFINARPTLFESSSVPLLLYGKDVLRGVKLPADAAGSHMDVAATLIETAAPKGFRYWAMGHNLFAPQRPSIGFTTDRIVGPDFLLEIGPGGRLEPIPGRPLPATLPDLEALTGYVRAMQGIAWWRVRHGSDLPRLARADEGHRER